MKRAISTARYMIKVCICMYAGLTECVTGREVFQKRIDHLDTGIQIQD